MSVFLKTISLNCSTLSKTFELCRVNRWMSDWRVQMQVSFPEEVKDSSLSGWTNHHDDERTWVERGRVTHQRLILKGCSSPRSTCKLFSCIARLWWIAVVEKIAWIKWRNRRIEDGKNFWGIFGKTGKLEVCSCRAALPQMVKLRTPSFLGLGSPLTPPRDRLTTHTPKSGNKP
jgi:hypothetical protein